MLRFAFQRECTRKALDTMDGLVLNVGAKEDPASLKDEDPERVINCDLFDHDELRDLPNRVDRLFDCARDKWPFKDGEAALVVLGDILEHLSPEEIRAALKEARRVGRRLCVTVPCDDRSDNNPQHAAKFPRGAKHRTIVTDKLLVKALVSTGWKIKRMTTVEYDDGTNWGKQIFGYFVQAS